MSSTRFQTSTAIRTRFRSSRRRTSVECAEAYARDGDSKLAVRPV
jgi:hypothetical protein